MSMPHETAPVASFEARCQRVLQFARDLYRQSPDWIRFFKEVVGVDGAARKVFTNQKEYIAFERSETFHTIQRMVNALRNNKATSSSSHEPTRVITVRLPESLHEALKAEANDHSTSMNKLCIAKLLQVLEEDEINRKKTAAAANYNTNQQAAYQQQHNQRYGQQPAAGQTNPNYNQMHQGGQRQNVAYNQPAHNRQITPQPHQNPAAGINPNQVQRTPPQRQNLNNPPVAQNPATHPNQAQSFRANNQPLANPQTARSVAANYPSAAQNQPANPNNPPGYANQTINPNSTPTQNPNQQKPQTPPYRPNQF